MDTSPEYWRYVSESLDKYERAWFVQSADGEKRAPEEVDPMRALLGSIEPATGEPIYLGSIRILLLNRARRHSSSPDSFFP
jgi:hypothetical protein